MPRATASRRVKHENRIELLARLDCACHVSINPTAPTFYEMLPNERSHSLPFHLPARGASADRYLAMHQPCLHTGQALRSFSVSNPSTLLGLRPTAIQWHKLCRGVCAWQ